MPPEITQLECLGVLLGKPRRGHQGVPLATQASVVWSGSSGGPPPGPPPVPLGAFLTGTALAAQNLAFAECPLPWVLLKGWVKG